MSAYDTLVGQRFDRNGTRLTIVECRGGTVLATGEDGVERVPVPLAEVLQALEVAEITVTELPRARRQDAQRLA